MSRYTGGGGFIPISAAWTPASLGASLLAWYDASNAGSLTLDGSNNVQQWNDLSGNANHVSQATAGSRPPFEATGLNSKQDVNFNGSTFLQNTSFGMGAGNTGSWFFVCIISSASAAFRSFMSYAAPSQGQSGANSGFYGTRNVDTSIGFTGQGGAATTIQTITDDTPLRIGQVLDSVNCTVYTNNSAGGGPTGCTFNWATAGKFTIGADDTGGFPGNARMSEIVITSSALDTPTMLLLDNYFRSHWGL